MLNTKTVKKFNEIRALIFAGSPQVREHDGHIVTFNEHGHIDSTVAVLAGNSAYSMLVGWIKHSPLSIELVEINGRPVIRDKAFRSHLAYMLT